jgi:hypothetical protein
MVPGSALLAPFTPLNVFGLYLTGVESVFVFYSIGVEFAVATAQRISLGKRGRFAKVSRFDGLVKSHSITL